MAKKITLFTVLFLIIPLFSYSQNCKEYRLNYGYNQIQPEGNSLIAFRDFVKTSLKDSLSKIVVQVYSDSVGGEASNLKIGRMRFEIVEKILRQELENLPQIVLENYTSSLQKQLKLSNDNARFMQITFYEVEKKQEAKIPQEVTVPPAKSFKIREKKEKKKDYKGETIVTSIFFIGDKSKYLADPTAELKNICAIYKNQPSLRLRISGHVCCENRKALSKKRAKRVYKDLIRMGIPKEKMSFTGYGNKRPLVEEVDEKSRQKNRRVEVEFF